MKKAVKKSLVIELSVKEAKELQTFIKNGKTWDEVDFINELEDVVTEFAEEGDLS